MKYRKESLEISKNTNVISIKTNGISPGHQVNDSRAQTKYLQDDNQQTARHQLNI